jgi:hypothetical protein
MPSLLWGQQAAESCGSTYHALVSCEVMRPEPVPLFGDPFLLMSCSNTIQFATAQPEMPMYRLQFWRYWM